ncbi:MAG: AAA family ATPase [Thermodesulfobacteriota bacterium]
MQCPQCQFDNREGVQFCEECGTKMELACPGCGARIPLKSKFCGLCGQALYISGPAPKTTATVPDHIATLSRYLPMGMAEKILAQKDRIEGEKRQVTVLFCDLAGYTPLTEQLGPEGAYDLMNRIYEILIHNVNKFEGTVNEMTGDGILGLFGAPIALEDAPQRAIRSALAIHWQMARLNEQLVKEGKTIPTLRMRVGIHTGPVVVGTLGNDLRVDFKVVGDTVNLASRMEGLAEPGTTYVTGDTFRLAEGFFRFEGLGKKEIKGKAGFIEVYRVIASSSLRTRFDVNAEQGLTPFIGRQREIDLLLDVYTRAKIGRGQAVSITADAGMGKSRLLYEFRKAMANEEVTFLEGKCLSYSRGISYHPVIDILKSQFDIQETDRDMEIRNKVKQGLQFLQIDEVNTLPYFLELLSIKDSGIDQNLLSPEGKKDQTIQALSRLVLNGAEIQPLILAVEDLHWIDRSSEDLLKNLVEHISGARVLLIFTYRTEYLPTWGIRSYHSKITLNRISNRETLAMTSHLLATDRVAVNLQDLIIEKTEGIPFFLEEFLKSLKELQFIRRQDTVYSLTKDPADLTIPSTIQDIIMARVDALPEGGKEILQIGSVIEREFSHELLRAATSFSEPDLLTHISALKDLELLYERGVYPNATYIFKHALTRDVVYDSILKKKRKKLHGQIGDVIEELYKDNINQHCEVLAEHYIANENYDKGAHYSKLAGKKARKAASFKDASEYQKASISCLEKLPQTEQNQKMIIDARTTLAIYHLALGHYSEAKEAVEPVMELALELNYRKRLPGIYMAMGLHAIWAEEDFSSGTPYINNAIRISEEIGDFLSLWFAKFHLGICLSLQCEFKKALSHFNKSMALSELAGDSIGVSYTKTSVVQVFYHQGDIPLACKVGKEASSLAAENGDVLSKGWAYGIYGCALYYKGEFEKAKKYLLEGLEYNQTSFFAGEAWTSWNLGNLWFEMGKFKNARKCYEDAIAVTERDNMFPSLTNAIKTDLTRLWVRTGGLDVGYRELFESFENNKLKLCEGIIARNIGDILLQSSDGQLADSEAWIKKAIYADTKNGTRLYLAADHALYAEWFKKKGDLSGAREQLSRAIEIFRECGADGWVEKYEGELDLLTSI